MTKKSHFKKPIYVLLYHPWMDGFQECFSDHLSWLRENKFESIPLGSLLHYLKGEEVLIPERPIVITLDDGSIENYTIAYPLLKQYQFTGTVFAPTAQKYIRKSGKDWWEEIEEKDILKIESHSHTHSLIFVSDRMEDFYIGKTPNLEPYVKGLDRRYGAPIFGLGYELVSQRFIPKKELMDWCVGYVKKQGGVVFFKREDWKENLSQVSLKYGEDRGHYETKEEKEKRISEELKMAKTIIQETLGNGKEVRFFAYPFGAYDSDLIECLKEAGYNGAFTTLPGGNHRGDDPFLIKRMTILEVNSFGGLAHILKEYLKDA
jgi:poly-beta-1,6-N-acetyl-D-glucosamine N-deacetylase